MPGVLILNATEPPAASNGDSSMSTSPLKYQAMIDGYILANAGGIINCASKEIPDPSKVRALAI